jgi:hypothetical protein
MKRKFVPLEEVVATAMTLVVPADDSDRNVFRQWAYLGLRDIGPTNAWVDDCVLYPEELKLPKPEYMYKPITLALYDANNTELLYAYRGSGRRVHSPSNSITADGVYDPNFGAVIDVSEDAYYFHLGSNATSVSYAKLKYLKLPVDENNNIMFPEDTVLAIALFIRYMWAARSNSNMVTVYERSWVMARNAARGRSKTPTTMEADEIVRKWITLIPRLKYKEF